MNIIIKKDEMKKPNISLFLKIVNGLLLILLLGFYTNSEVLGQLVSGGLPLKSNFHDSVPLPMNNIWSLHWGIMIMGLLGGVAIFLYGMDLLSQGLKRIADKRIKTILHMLTNNRIMGMIVGAVVTVLVQSSSATTVLLVGFVQSGLISFSESVGVILGADIGTTITAQFIALKLADYALILVIVGYTLQFYSRRNGNLGQYFGLSIMGTGFLFYGMKLMSDSMTPLQGHPEVVNMLKTLENPAWGIICSATITALIHSSAATIGMVIVLSQQGLIHLDASIPLIFGANIGTCFTAAIASWQTSREAQRVAIAHVLFKIGGVLLFIWWIPHFAYLVKVVSNYLGQDVTRQVANAHTLFNVGLALVFLPFTGVLAKVLVKLYPDKVDKKIYEFKTKYLDNAFLSAPNLGTAVARLEISRMAQLVEEMLEPVIVPFISGNWPRDSKYPQLSFVEALEFKEKKVDFLEEKITEYLMAMSRNKISENESNEIFALASITKDMESIGDVIHKNLIPLLEKKQRMYIHFSFEGGEELRIYHLKICKQISRLCKMLAEIDAEKIKHILHKAENYLELENEYRKKHLERLQHKRSESIYSHEVHMELMDYLKHINTYIGNIAKTMSIYSNHATE